MAASLAFVGVPADDLPLIDLGLLRRGSPAEVRRTAERIGAAARDIGFFRVSNHGVDLKLIDATYRAVDPITGQ